MQKALFPLCQVGNALCALGLALAAGADPEGAVRGISGFGGVRRRFELHAGPRGGMLINDYAHHPAEIRVVLRAARQRFPGRRMLCAVGLLVTVASVVGFVLVRRKNIG